MAFLYLLALDVNKCVSSYLHKTNLSFFFVCVCVFYHMKFNKFKRKTV